MGLSTTACLCIARTYAPRTLDMVPSEHAFKELALDLASLSNKLNLALLKIQLDLDNRRYQDMKHTDEEATIPIIEVLKLLEDLV